MTRHHRRAHRAIWMLLAVLVGALFLAALANRPPPEARNGTTASPSHEGAA